VVVIGNAASGQDISREIARVAKEVHVSGRTWNPDVDFSEPIGEHGNIWLHSTVTTSLHVKKSWVYKRFRIQVSCSFLNM
jgi:cation diffusion facilitator CzcD-associated flavoprotein CzcO